MRGLLGFPLAVLSRLRRVAYDSGLFPVDRLRGPVISVGNLAVGGRGKTPVVARVCALVREEGRAVAVLSRGYLGAFRGDCLLVSDGQRVTAGFEQAGDEPDRSGQDDPPGEQRPGGLWREESVAERH